MASDTNAASLARRAANFPFSLANTALVEGADLDHDFALYSDLASRFSILPSAMMLPFAGPEALDLFKRRVNPAERWREFQVLFDLRNPALAATRDEAEAAVAAIPTGYRRTAVRPTMPEVVVGQSLLQSIPARVAIRRDVTLGIRLQGGHTPRCDYELTSQCGRVVRIEVNGMTDRLGRSYTFVGRRYGARQPRRLKVYASAGLDTPVVVHVDELCDPLVREAAIDRILAALRI